MSDVSVLMALRATLSWNTVMRDNELLIRAEVSVGVIQLRYSVYFVALPKLLHF
jgi:hypothetical protein